MQLVCKYSIWFYFNDIWFQQAFSDKVVIARSFLEYFPRAMFSSFLIFCYYFTRLKSRHRAITATYLLRHLSICSMCLQVNPVKAKLSKLIIFWPKLFTSWFWQYKAKKLQNFEFLYFDPRNIGWQLELSMADSGVKK